LILNAQISFVPGGGAKIKIDMPGDWNAKISFDGPQGQQSFPMTANEIYVPVIWT